MGKFLIFSLLWWIVGNPFIAILILLVVLYLLDRRFLGLSPSLAKPLRRRSRIAKLRQQLMLNPNDIAAKHELARALIERKSYRDARKTLESMGDALEDSAEYWDDLGTAYLQTGEPEKGEEAIGRALSINPRVKYGEPYLRLAGLYSQRGQSETAIRYLEAFGVIHSSSSEAYYKLGLLYTQLGRSQEARQAFDEAGLIYQSLPRYKKRQERRWALLSKLRKMRA
ncbi:tetratricopeptide repeat protein [Paenibacillus sp. 1P07SE]|uniref:tetratricopeptide repeat protein n=1 Tax=Paenibacillus sp. 1P07SE TaxID=3132209 RepID=UPI0039A4154C